MDTVAYAGRPKHMATLEQIIVAKDRQRMRRDSAGGNTSFSPFCCIFENVNPRAPTECAQTQCTMRDTRTPKRRDQLAIARAPLHPVQYCNVQRSFNFLLLQYNCTEKKAFTSGVGEIGRRGGKAQGEKRGAGGARGKGGPKPARGKERSQSPSVQLYM